MLDIRLTPAAEAVYAEEASMLGQTVETFLNQTLPQEMAKVIPQDASYIPTAEDWILIRQGLQSLKAGKATPHDEVWAKIDQI
jgi:predicted transcriptional regulator